MLTNHNHNIRNLTYKDALQKGLIQAPCDVSLYPMMIQGSVDKNVFQISIRIWGCLHTPFHGPHFVSIENSEPFWVQSLTCLKRQFFNFTDRLSFERCIYLIVSDQIFLRLKNVRCIATLPQLVPSEGTPIWKNVRENEPFVTEQTHQSKTSSDKVRKTMLQNCIQQLLTTYSRGGSDLQTIADSLRQDFLEELQDFVVWGHVDAMVHIDSELLELLERECGFDTTVS